MTKNKTSIPLPKLYSDPVPTDWFPTKMQALIFRLWESVSAEKLAEVLETTAENVEKQAFKMGLLPQTDLEHWHKKGYITILRNVWHLLPYEQILTLLDWDEARLAFTLKEDDFLDVKLGFTSEKDYYIKPNCEKITYRELTEEEEKRTLFIKSTMEEHIRVHDSEPHLPPFDFFNLGYRDMYTKKISDGICGTYITSDWSVCDMTGGENVTFFVDRFINSMKKDWDIDLAKSQAAGINSIILTLNADKNGSEYHEINILNDRIEISAADEIGILRALSYLEDKAKINGAPCYKEGRTRRKARFGARYIYLYCGLYNDSFDVDSTEYCPDELLEAYSKVGINGIWMQAVLYRMTEFPYEKELSQGWEDRLNRLADLAARAIKYGIKIYLYINEPRAMSLEFFEKYPHLKGTSNSTYACMCTSVPEVLNYLKNSIKTICNAVPYLGGFFTITISENRTNCYSIVSDPNMCPRCAERKPEEIIAEVNGAIAEAAHSVNPDINVIAWTWAWDESYKMKCIDIMPDDVILMSKSEEDMKFEIAGIKGEVHDYTMSIAGPGDVAKEIWKRAKASGKKTAAKLQLNCTWECSTVPFLPVFEQVKRIMTNVAACGVENIMMSWTLGGYPSPNIKIASMNFFENLDGEDEKTEDFFKVLYGENAETIKKATDKFSEAFREFPFDIRTLYTGPQNGGPSNPIYELPTGKSATMTCYTYDDIDSWHNIFPVDIFESQFGKVCKIWEEGLSILGDIENCELRDVSYVGYSLFKASYNQIRFIRAREEYLKTDNKEKLSAMIEILKDELSLAEMVYTIMRRNPTIGYEAANHYYFSQGTLSEKVINCKYLIDLYERKML